MHPLPVCSEKEREAGPTGARGKGEGGPRRHEGRGEGKGSSRITGRKRVQERGRKGKEIGSADFNEYTTCN